MSSEASGALVQRHDTPRSRLWRVLIYVALALVCAMVAGYFVHAHLFAIPSGELIGTSASPSGTMEGRSELIWPPPGGSFALKIDVREKRSSPSSWRTVYVGPDESPSSEDGPTWLDDRTILVRGHRVAVEGEARVGAWLTVGQAAMYWLLTIVLSVAVFLGVLSCLLLSYWVLKMKPSRKPLL